ncbi:unnamed protein product [Penicillium bialowiezense]
MSDENVDSHQREVERPKQNAIIKRPWIPWTLRRPFLCSLASLFLIFGIVLEVLRQVSGRKHGLVIYKTVNEMPKVISGVYIYVPMVFAVVAVTLWQFCAGDALRLEPYFQLAKPEGVSATVLFTNYTFHHGIMAPTIAARNRHWLVLLISSLSLISRMSLPSLLSGLVVLTEVTLDETKTVTTWPKLLDLDAQQGWFSVQSMIRSNSSVMRTADDVFLYRSSDYASPAVAMPIDENETSILSINQTVYWSDISCQNLSFAKVTWAQHSTDAEGEDLLQWRTTQLDFPSDQTGTSCSVNLTLNTTTPRQGGPFQLSYWEPTSAGSVPDKTSAFQSSDCELYALFGLLVDTEEGSQLSAGNSSNATAFACSVNYRSAEAAVKIAVDASISEVNIDHSSTKDLKKSQFSDAGFHQLLKSQHFGLQKLSSKDSSILPGWLGSSESTLDLDRASSSPLMGVPEYQLKIKNFWKSRFIIAMDKLFDVRTPTEVKASQASTVVTLQVLSTPAISAETLFLAAALLLVSLSFVYPRRPNFLESDPGSIIAQCTVVADRFTAGNPLTKSSGQFSHATSRQLRRWAKNFKCQWVDSPHGKKIDIVPVSSKMSQDELALPSARRLADRSPHFVIWPWFLAECLFLIGTLVTYGFALRCFSAKNIDEMTRQQFGFLVFLLFGPTLVSSLVSSLLGSILRYSIVIETWGRLQKGKAGIEQSLGKNYGSHIPISVLFHNICQGPILLIALSVICTLGLVHTVVSGGMFEPQIKVYSNNATGLSERYNSTSFHVSTPNVRFDGMGLMLSSLNRGTPIVPWQDDKTAFLPLSKSESIADQVDTVRYSARTVGIGANLNCHEINLGHPWVDSRSGSTSWNYTTPSGLSCTVEAPSVTKHGLIKRSISYLQPNAMSSVENGCQSTVMVLARWDTMQSSPTNSQNSVVLSCDVSISSDAFEVSFSPEGIISSAQLATHLGVLGDHASKNMSQSTAAHFNKVIMGYSNSNILLGNMSFFHYDWPGMMTAVAYNRLEPNSQLSLDPAFLIIAAQSTYQEIFSSYLTFNRDLYFERYPESIAPNVNGIRTVNMWRLFPSAVSMTLALVLLSMDVVIVVIIFATRSSYFRAPRIPTSLGSLMPWIAGSEMMSDLRANLDTEENKMRIYQGQSERLYHFGLCHDTTEEGRWLLDYDHSISQQGDYELGELSDSSPIERRTRGKCLRRIVRQNA